MLYRYTGDKKYLDFALYIVKSWEQPNGPHIVETLLTKGDVHLTANGKAYEMMSCLVGLVDLYRLTGDPKFLKVAGIAWTDIATKRLYITGTTSAHEHFRDDFDLPGLASSEVGEGCATVTWLQLSWQLLRATGEQKYADELERTVFNQLLAAQDPADGNICYFTPLIGKKRPGPGINCCVSSEPRGISMIPQLAWGAKDGGVAVLLYAPGEVTVNGATLKTATGFPADGAYTITVEPAGRARFPLYLRVPQWTAKYTAKAGGRTFSGKPGEFLKIERNWRKGDKVEVAMDMTVRVVPGGKSYPEHVAVVRGPEVLALDRARNPGVPDLHLVALQSASPAKGVVVKPDASGKLAKMEQPLALIPFRDATSYRVWLMKPEFLKVQAGSATAFASESWSRGGAADGSIVDERADTYRTTNRGKAPTEDWFAVELDNPERITRIVFRHGKTFGDGGWFDSSAGKPRVQIRKPGSKEWETVGTLTAYPDDKAALTDGQAFELKLDAPLDVAAIRVIGKPANYTSCAELSAYR